MELPLLLSVHRALGPENDVYLQLRVETFRHAEAPLNNDNSSGG
jgi:hypothetical protein